MTQTYEVLCLKFNFIYSIIFLTFLILSKSSIWNINNEYLEIEIYTSRRLFRTIALYTPTAPHQEDDYIKTNPRQRQDLDSGIRFARAFAETYYTGGGSCDHLFRNGTAGGENFLPAHFDLLRREVWKEIYVCGSFASYKTNVLLAGIGS